MNEDRDCRGEKRRCGMKEIFFDGRIFKSMKDFSEFARIPTSTVRRWNFLGLLSSPEQLEKCMKKHRAHGSQKRPNAIKHHDETLKSKKFNVWNENESFSSIDYPTLCERIESPDSEIKDAIDYGIKCNGFFIDEAF